MRARPSRSSIVGALTAAAGLLGPTAALAQPAAIDGADTAWMIGDRPRADDEHPGPGLVLRRHGAQEELAGHHGADPGGDASSRSFGRRPATAWPSPATAPSSARSSGLLAEWLSNRSRRSPDHPGIPVHALPDDVRGHHGGAGRRLGRRSMRFSAFLCSRACGSRSSTCRSRIGCGAAAFWQAGVLDFAGGTVVHLNAGVAGLIAAYVIGPRRGYGGKSLALRPVARRGRHRPVVGRLVRLQRRLGACRRLARRLRDRRHASGRLCRRHHLDVLEWWTRGKPSCSA